MSHSAMRRTRLGKITQAATFACLVAAGSVGLAQKPGQRSEVEEQTGSSVQENGTNRSGQERSGQEPPKLLRGSFVQQLRSVTESVLGTSDSKNKNAPTPPPPEPNYVTYSGERYGSGSPTSESKGSAKPNAGNREPSDSDSGKQRGWAGQFLIPGTKNGIPKPPPVGSEQPKPQGRAGSNLGAAAKNAVNRYRNEASDDAAESTDRQETSVGSAKATTNTGREKVANSNVPKAPASSLKSNSQTTSRNAPVVSSSSGSGAISFHLSDRSQAEEVEADSEVETTTSDVPRVPKKPAPKRTAIAKTDAAPNAATKPVDKVAVRPKTTKETESKSDASSRGAAIGSAIPSADQTAVHSGETQSAINTLAMPKLSTPAAESGSVPSATLRPLSNGANDAKSLADVQTEGVSLPLPTLPSDQPSLALPTLPSTPTIASSIPALSAPSLPSLSSLPSTSQQNSGTASFATDAAKEMSVPSLPSLSPSESIGKSQAAATTAALPQTPAASLPRSTAPTAPKTTPSPSVPAVAAVQGDERLNMDIPHVNVKLLGPADLTAGQPTDYKIVVSNVDKIPLAGLILRMETPAGVEVTGQAAGKGETEFEKADDGATLFTWAVPSLAPGTNMTLPVRIKTDSPKNFAVGMEWTVLPASGVEEIVVQHADLQLAFEGPAEVEKDVANIYKLRVFNPGNAVAKNVKVQVGADAQDTSDVDIGELGPGQAEIIEMDLTFEKAGSVTIKAAGSAQGNLSRAGEINVTVRQPLLTAKLALPATSAVGESMNCLVEVVNTGDAAARNVQAGLAIPVGAELVNPPAGVSKQGDKIMWKVDAIAAGQTSVMPLNIKLASAGETSLRFACVSATGAVSTVDATTTVEAFSDLKLLVNDPPSPAQVGAPVTYEVTVTNRGSREANNVKIVAQFSDGIEPECAAGSQHKVVPGQVLFDPIPSIAPGQTIKLQVTAKASGAGIHRFRAEVRSDDSDARLVEEEATRFLDSASRIAMPPSTSVVR